MASLKRIYNLDCYLKKAITSDNIIFTHRAIALGPRSGFKEAVAVDTSDFVGRSEYTKRYTQLHKNQ